MAVKRMNDLADGLVATAQLFGNLTGMAAPLTGQEALAAVHGKTQGRAQPRVQGLLLLVCEGTKGNRFTHATEDTISHIILFVIALVHVHAAFFAMTC